MTADASPAVTSAGLFYPDISGNQQDIDLSGIYAVCIKCTEGTYYTSPYYNAQVARAQSAGAFHFAYHFLTDEDPKAQAQLCFDRVGPHVPLMVDVETETLNRPPSNPSIGQNVAFVRHFRDLGGTVYLNYLPEWYWSSVWGSPDLAPLKDLGLLLVSSVYANYSSNIGWKEYGNWTPTIWQYSDRVFLHGQYVDFNAFEGSGTHDVPTMVEEFKSIVTTGKFPSRQRWQELITDGNQTLEQIATTCGMKPAKILRTAAVHYGEYDPVIAGYLDQVFTGAASPTANIPPGAKLWVLK